MANDHNIKPFEIKKGEVKNPRGRPRLLISDTINQLKAEGVKQPTKAEITAVYLMLINLTISELKEKSEDGQQPALVRIVSKAIISGKKGFEIIEKVLDRSLGKAGGTFDITTGGKEITTINLIEVKKVGDSE